MRSKESIMKNVSEDVQEDFASQDRGLFLRSRQIEVFIDIRDILVMINATPIRGLELLEKIRGD